jgi:hypothetical protein
LAKQKRSAFSQNLAKHIINVKHAVINKYIAVDADKISDIT